MKPRLAFTSSVAVPDVEIEDAIRAAFSPMRRVLLWNDDRIHFETPVMALQAVLGLPRHRAFHLTALIHRRGKGVIALTTLERAELIQQRLEGYKLTVTIERNES